jgi:hypothetical protein
MIFNAKSGFILAGVFACAATVAQAAVPAVPAEVTSLVGRIQTCVHFGGEEPYDKARAAEIDKAMDDAKCDAVPADEAAMRKKYAKDAKILKLFTDADNF